jgi:shikimate 5-dehydrogenase
VNATPQSPVTRQELTGARCVYDLVYNPLETQFMRSAHEAGCETLGGLEMLIAQAEKQFELWTGKNFSDGFTTQVKTDLIRVLGGNP